MIDRIMAQLPAFFTWANGVFLLTAFTNTLIMTIVGCAVGFALGMSLAALRRTSGRWLMPLRMLALLWVETFRRLPFLIILILVLFTVQAIAPDISLLGIATISVTLAASAYLSEIVRGGLDSVPQTQIDAAAAMNFSAWQSFWLVILPQSWRVILPPAAAFMVMFVKDTSLASHLGVVELTFSGKILVNRGFSPLLGFGTVLVLYFALSWPLGRLAARLEERLAPSRHQ